MKDYCFKIFNLKTSQQFFLLMFFLIQSCEEDLTKINQNKKTNFASQVIYNGNIIQRDSGIVKVNFKAPLIEKYELIDSPYIEAKKESTSNFLIKNQKIREKSGQSMQNIMRRKILFCKRKSESHYNRRSDFVMETINWDKRNKKMYTKDTVFVSDKDGNILVGSHGMIAKDDFTEYTFFNNSGSFNSTNLPATSK
jgi:hypothetical protein